MAEAAIPCKYVKATGVRMFLRVYWDGVSDQLNHGGWPYHDAQSFLKDVPIEEIFVENSDGTHSYKDKNHSDHPTRQEYQTLQDRWPKKCDYCNEAVPVPSPDTDLSNYDMGKGPVYQYFDNTLYDSPPRPKQPGDIYDAPWMAGGEKDCWAVVLPNDLTWYTYMTASNCRHGPEMQRTIHKCWSVTGTPPNIDVVPSIWMQGGHEWHGWLRQGKLVKA